MAANATLEVPAAQPSPRPAARSSHLLLGIIIGGLGAAILGAVLLAPVALTHHDASSFEAAYGSAVVGLVSRIEGARVGPNPVADNARALATAQEAYAGSCAECHGAAGDGRGEFGQTTFPPATDLTSRSTRELSDGQLFAIIKDGLGFTPMPAYGGQYADQQIWGLVSLIRAIQNGQAPQLPVGAASAGSGAQAQGDAQARGDAQRGAAVYAAEGCGACHGPSGDLSLAPPSPQLAGAVRGGRPGMPCYSTAALSDQQLADLQAYVATFPSGGRLGGSQDRGAGQAAPPGATGGAGGRGGPGGGPPGGGPGDGGPPGGGRAGSPCGPPSGGR